MRMNMAAPGSVPPETDGGQGRVSEMLAAKLLAAWLANRRQTLMPHTLNFRAVDPDEVELLLAVMGAAAQAGGTGPDERADERARRALALAGANADEAARHAAMLAAPQPLFAVADAVAARQAGPRAYAAALLAADRASPAAAAFLAYLAARWALPPDLVAALESRYRA